MGLYGAKVVWMWPGWYKDQFWVDPKTPVSCTEYVPHRKRIERNCCLWYFRYASNNSFVLIYSHEIIEPRHEFSNNVVYATSKSSDQPGHTRSLIRAFASRLNIL